ncbi:MAG: DsbA family protein [Vicinamibacteria bacterium]
MISRLVLPVREDRDHILGPPNAPVTLLEYGDYECPSCGAAHPQVKRVRRLMGDRLRFVYRHFPLANIHPQADRAAEAAEAAGAQGHYWAIHDRFFEHQDALGPRDLLAHAEAVGLDPQRFAAELSSGVHLPKVREDFLNGVRSGVNGTPTFFIDGVRHDGGYDAESLIEALELALETR